MVTLTWIGTPNTLSEQAALPIPRSGELRLLSNITSSCNHHTYDDTHVVITIYMMITWPPYDDLIVLQSIIIKLHNVTISIVLMILIFIIIIIVAFCVVFRFGWF